MKQRNKYQPVDLQTKSFTIEIKGYKVEEINDFLDEVQHDYLYFLEELKTLNEELAFLKTENLRLTKNLEVVRQENELLNVSRVKMTKNELANSDVVSRIAHIESSINEITKLLKQQK